MYQTRKMCVVSCRMNCHIDEIRDDLPEYKTYSEAREWCLDEFERTREDTVLAGVVKYLYEDEDIQWIYFDYQAINTDTNTIAYSKRVYYY